MNFKEILDKTYKKISLSEKESIMLFTKIMEGKCNNEEIKKILLNLSEKGESVEEITGGVKVLRDKSIKVEVNGDILDTCGTGGDGKNTLNISTAVALVLASMDCKIAKHGNKSVSSKSGSANVLEKLGININLKPEEVAKSINEKNFGFMFAPNYHSAMKNVATARSELKRRTIFNLLGPLLNPANVNRQCIGVYSEDILMKYVEVLKNIGLKKAWVYHSSDGLDEISTFEKTKVYQLENNEIKSFEIDPKKFIKSNYTISDIIGGDPDYNAKELIKIFKGENHPGIEIISINSAAGLIVLDKFSSLEGAFEKVKNHIKSGNVFEYLKRIKE